MSLYVRDLADGSTAIYELEGSAGADARWACRYGGRHGERRVRGLSGSFTWAPDGETIVYARKSNTWEGFDYADLYAIDLENGDRRRLTRKRRATEPAFGPDGERIAFVGQQDGSSNLYLLDLETEEVRPLTGFGGGTQVGAPVWHPSGDWIYFERTDGAPRDIWRIRPDGSGVEPVRERPWNERQPAFSPDGEQLVLASDSSGIYNLYRGGADGTGLRPVTNVVGGAFMPAVGPRESLAFARFRGGGYEIATLKAPSPVEPSHLSYEAPEVLREERRPETRPLAARGPLAVSPSDSAAGTDAPARESRSYEHSFSPFSVMPIYRLDMYAKDRPTAAGRLWRNSKAGLFFASREVLDRIRLSGSLTLGLGSEEASSVGDFFSPSRLIDLERDAFLQLDYSGGLGFIPKRWSPQFSVALYNTRRNVNDGLAIEEFPCTACYPDTTRTDVSYSLWEADLRLRSKISRSLLVTLGYRYSPYQVTYESFYSRENRQNVPGASDQYFIGRALDLQLSYEALRPYRHADVLPQGIRAAAGYEYQPGRLLDRFALEGGQLVPKFADYDNHRFWLETRLGVGLPGSVRGAPHGVNARLEVSSILGGPVDEFFDEYVGGLTGARGYPFYALGGNETAWAQIAYHVPILPSIGAQVGPIYADKLYGRLYADAVSTWSGRLWDVGPVRTDVGAELRLGLGTFYLVPAAFFVSGTYGLDRFEVRLDEEFVTEGTGSTVSYGGEWLWHFGLLFNFDL